MRAWLYDTQGLPAEVLQLCSAAAEPTASSATPIIIDVHAIALNPDSSVLMRIIPSFLLSRSPRLPEIDFAGVISKVDKESSRCSFKMGDKVFGHIPPIRHVTGNIGVLARKVAVSPEWIIPKPGTLTCQEAAALPTAFVSSYKLASYIRNGSKVFVNGGSGGIGLILLQILRNWKEANVTTTASQQSWHVVQKFQPNNVVNYKDIEDLPNHLQENFESFDYAIDLVGDKSLLRQSHRFLGKDGVFVAFGGGLSSPSIWGFVSWLVKAIAIGYLPSWLGGCGRDFRFVTVSKEKDTIEGLRALEEFRKKGWVHPSIDSTFAFEDALQGYDRLASRHADGKVVIQVDECGPGVTSLPFPT